jgi:apolipoprotein N-acyltransferase
MTRDKDEPTPSPAPKLPFIDRKSGRTLLALLCVTLLTLSYAPIGQFYLAWIGLVPWLILIARAQSNKTVFWWSWLTGLIFFALNMWWLVFVTWPGAITLMIYLGFYFVLAGLILRATNLLNAPTATRSLTAVLLIPTLWVAAEWTRGNLFTGLPWLYLGHTQSPILTMCQVADTTSAYGISFWVVLINSLVALFILHRPRWTHLVPAAATVAAVLVAVLAYGIFRTREDTAYPGPVVMVVQPNYPQDNSGAKGAPLDEIASFHINKTRDALSTLRAQGQFVDLIVWSETMMPDLNKEFRQYLRDHSDPRPKERGKFYDLVHDDLIKLAEEFRTNLLVGGTAMMPDRSRPGRVAWNRFNSAYLFDLSGRGASWRYDKIHLVPFGEFIPFRESFPPLYKFFNLFNPYDSDYTVTQGKEFTVFAIPPRAALSSAGTPPSIAPAPYRFVAPICFEDIDSRLVSEMFRGESGVNPKRAQFLVNLTNDGWFRANEMAQHLQAATFRSIENRAPTARSVNTGISGFVDPLGRTHDLVPAGTEGVATAKLTLDRRLTFYTQNGDVFPCICGTIAGCVTFVLLYRWIKNRRAVRRYPSKAAS